MEKKPRKKATPRVKKVKLGKAVCYFANCENNLDMNLTGRYCTMHRLFLAEETRVSYNAWKESRGLPVETAEEEIIRWTDKKE